MVLRETFHLHDFLMNATSLNIGHLSYGELGPLGKTSDLKH